jgi:NTE family protein
MTSRDLLLKESRALASVAISENPRLYGEYFKYINPKRTLRAVLDYYFEAIDFPVYRDFRLFQTFRSSYHIADVQLQRNLNRFSYIGIGQQFIHARIKTLESPSLVYSGTNDHWHSYASYVLNSINRKHFPTQGWVVRAEAGYAYQQDPDFELTYSDSAVTDESIGVTFDDYAKVTIRAGHYSSINDQWSWSQHLVGGYIIEDRPYIADQFLVGGISEIVRNQVTFAGLNESEIKTGSIASLQFALQYALSAKAFLIGRVNGAVYNFHQVDVGDLGSSNFLSGYGLTFGLNSPLGPIELTTMYCDQDGMVRTGINIGYSFY